jgi:hypothetical protein
MNARPRSPANSHRLEQVVTPRQQEALQCTEEEELEVALEAGHLSTRQMFALARCASTSSVPLSIQDSRHRKAEYHLATCKCCLRDFSEIAAIVAEDCASEAGESSRGTRRNTEPHQPALELLTVVCVQSRESLAGQQTPPAQLRLSTVYARDGDLKIWLTEIHQAFRLEVHHTRFPPGTMLRIQHEKPRHEGAICSLYLVLRKEPFLEGTWGDVAIKQEAVCGKEPREITVDVLASAIVLQETDVKSLRRSFTYAVLEDSSSVPRRTAVLAAWRIWARGALQQRSIDSAIQHLAREICGETLGACTTASAARFPPMVPSTLLKEAAIPPPGAFGGRCREE